jgi:hypothetical protein
MSQEAPDLPRFVQIIGQYRALVGVMALLGLFVGAIFAALNPPVFTSQALVQMAAPSCPNGAICGGPAFSMAYQGPRLLHSLPSGARIKSLPGNVLLVTTTARTPAQAEATAGAAARSYLSYADSLSYPGEASAVILEPATRATGTTPMRRLFDDALLGAVFGALFGVITALAASGSTIDTVAAPPGYNTGEEKVRARQEIRYPPSRLTLQQMGQEYVRQRTALDSAPD